MYAVESGRLLCDRDVQKSSAFKKYLLASVSFATKQLRVSANNQEELLPKMQAAIDAIEDGVTLVPRKRKSMGISATKTYILR